MARLTDDADYDAGETSGNVPNLRSDSGNAHAYYVFRTRCVPLGLPANMTKLQDQGQTTSTKLDCREVKIGGLRKDFTTSMDL
ncbi:unnamed protein product [Protopolystoma xenopodis]|uniref:Uncharacterized protein n=1 Tax=Protopolystoma xenopodis TaxID=117903 RepID=A0A3S5BS87_9PLAT|nr:unnamed protein product [Protopolystoma xenopodis]